MSVKDVGLRRGGCLHWHGRCGRGMGHGGGEKRGWIKAVGLGLRDWFVGGGGGEKH